MFTVKKIVVIGASGYAGAELVGLLCKHNKVSISHLLVSENSSSTGMLFSELHGKFKNICDLPLTAFSEAWFEQNIVNAEQTIDAVFFATPHQYSADWAHKFIDAGVKVFDLSGGFRLKNADDYPTYYGFEHKDTKALLSAEYGFAEWQQADILKTNLVAVPGCYPTASLVALKPVTVNNFHIEGGLIVVNGISGVTGAGRNASLATNFNEVSLKPYNILQHRHQPEISQEAKAEVIFNPHLAPYKRGLLATVTLQVKATVTKEMIDKAFQEAYQNEALVRLVDTWPEINNVAYTPFADVHWKLDEKRQTLVISCAIDNLLKGASSQAVQCFNISFGLNSEYSLLG
jgi:N-acetyl-gamma-glutamyl-phosphate reductase